MNNEKPEIKLNDLVVLVHALDKILQRMILPTEETRPVIPAFYRLQSFVHYSKCQNLYKLCDLKDEELSKNTKPQEKSEEKLPPKPEEKLPSPQEPPPKEVHKKK